MPGMNRSVVHITWNTAYAANIPIDHYEIRRNGELVGSIPHKPQIDKNPFCFYDPLSASEIKSAPLYQVITVDKKGKRAKAHEVPLPY